MLWNAIKTGVRLKLGMTNPYQIKPQFCLLSQTNPQSTVHFMQKKQINRHSHLFRFALPEQNKCLGLAIGQYIDLKIDDVAKPYSPVSRIDDAGFIDLIVRDMRKENGENSFTASLMTLKQGDPVQVIGPKTQYIYRGKGQLSWPGKQPHKYKHIGIMAVESGITGVYQLIDSIMPNYDNTVGGRQMDDFIFLEQFSMLAEQQRLNFNVMLHENRPGWIGPYGKISKAHIENYMPSPGDDTAMMVVASSKDNKQIRQLLGEMGYEHIVPPAR